MSKDKPISPKCTVNNVKPDSSMVAYIGWILKYSRGKQVFSLESLNSNENTEDRLQEIVSKVWQKWQLDNIALVSRIGKLKVGDTNLVIAVAAAHREETFAACQHASDRIK